MKDEPKPKPEPTAYQQSRLDESDTFAERNIKRLNGVTTTAAEDYKGYDQD